MVLRSGAPTFIWEPCVFVIFFAFIFSECIREDLPNRSPFVVISWDKSSKRPSVCWLFAQIKQFWVACFFWQLALVALLITFTFVESLQDSLLSFTDFDIIGSFIPKDTNYPLLPNIDVEKTENSLISKNMGFNWYLFGSQLWFPHVGQFWVMGVLAGIGTEVPPERGIIRDKHTWHHSPPAQWMGWRLGHLWCHKTNIELLVDGVVFLSVMDM